MRLPLPGRSAEQRNLAPDLLRALAILLVMTWHLPGEARPAWLMPVRSFGWAGVDVFFVLSGYLIGKQLLSELVRNCRLDVAAFYVRRASRILPAFLVVLSALTLFPTFLEGRPIQLLWRFLTFTMNFGLDFQETGTFTNAWSLCVEEHFYLLFPLIVIMLSRWRSPWVTLLSAAAILVAGMALRYAIWEHIFPAEPGAYRYPPAEYLRSIYYPSYCRIDGLLCGALVAAMHVFYPQAWVRFSRPKVALPLGAVLIGGGLILFGTSGPTLSLAGAAFGYPAFAAGVSVALAGLIGLERAFKGMYVPGARTIAVLSYSLYLTHKPVIHVARTLIGSTVLQGTFGAAAYFMLCLPIAYLLWACVEGPFIDIKRRVISARKSAQPDNLAPVVAVVE
jgi:peptidoglycan/LPS O-acetylase OafA/YrhL